MKQISDPERARRLGALLRLADGLDFGHLQDAEIERVQFLTRKVRLLVRTPLFPADIERATRKANLWQAVFPLQVEIVRQDGSEPPPLLVSGLPLLEAARRLLMCQFRTVAANVDGALSGKSMEPLHDIRVALRRCSVLLWAFRKPLANTSAREIECELRQLNRELGPARDLDVWIEFLTSAEMRRQVADHAEWSEFIERQRQARQEQEPVVQRLLGEPEFSTIKEKVGLLLRIELPRLVRQGAEGSLKKVARQALHKRLRQAMKLSGLRRSKIPEDLHRLRIALRKARYFAEHFGPILGKSIDKLSRRIHAVEQGLGSIHDVDVIIQRLAEEGPATPRSVAVRLRKNRKRHLRKLAKAWDRFRKPALQRAVRKALN